jgi:hypothetical protein
VPRGKKFPHTASIRYTSAQRSTSHAGDHRSTPAAGEPSAPLKTELPPPFFPYLGELRPHCCFLSLLTVPHLPPPTTVLQEVTAATEDHRSAATIEEPNHTTSSPPTTLPGANPLPPSSSPRRPHGEGASGVPAVAGALGQAI